MWSQSQEALVLESPLSSQQPLLVMLVTNHQPMITRLKERKIESISLVGYAQEVTLLKCFLI